MKKLLSLTAVAALITLATLSGCKKEEPSFNGDFTNLTVELMQSTIGVDSALIVDKLKKDGFVITEYDSYINNSYGLIYSMQYKNGKLVSIVAGKQYTDELLQKNKYIEENNKLVSKNYPLFKGQAKEKEAGEYVICEKDPYAFQTKVSNTNYPIYFSYYSDTKITIGVIKYTYAYGMDFGIEAEQYTTDSYMYKELTSSCK